MWLREDSCEGIIISAWSKLVVGLPLFQVCENIQFTRCALLTWQKKVFGSMKVEIAKVQDKLGVLFEHPPSAEVYEARGELMG
ncbi:hypothetical protein ACFX2C_006494 [Malus domestica]